MPVVSSRGAITRRFGTSTTLSRQVESHSACRDPLGDRSDDEGLPLLRLGVQVTRIIVYRKPVLGTFHFETPDHDTFPALQLGYEVARRGGTCGAVLNAANEAAVGKFLAGELRFLDIPRACRAVLSHHDFSARPTLEEVWAADRWARH